MGHERWFRGQQDGQERPFDWLTAARQNGVPEKLARALYERAVQQAHGSTQGSVQALYLALLADARQDATRPAPGKVTRTMRIQSGRSARQRRTTHVSPVTGQPMAPGKRTATSYIEPPRSRRHQDHSGTEPEPLAAMAGEIGRPADAAITDSRPTHDRWDMAAVNRNIAASLGFLEMDPVSEAEPGSEILGDATLEQPLAGAAEYDGHDLDAPQPLAAAVSTSFMSRMAHAFGQRFDHVRIQRDSLVPAGRQAFTRGQDIHLGPDAPAPDSLEAERILAHELAHVAQRSMPATAWQSRPPSISALEVDAHQAALHALAGQAAAVRLAAPAGLALGFTDDPDALDEEPTRRARPGSGPGSAGPGAPADRGAGARPAAGPIAGPEAAPAPAPAPAPAGARAPAEPARPSGAGPAAQPGAGPAARPAGAPPTSASGNEPLLAEAPDTLSEAAQGRLAQIDTGAQSAAERVTELPTADESAAAARGAVTEPQEEQDARAQAGVAQAIDDRPPPSPEIEAACERIREVIQSKRPPDEESLVDAQPREMAAEAGGEMNAGIESRADSVRDGYADMETTPAGQPSREAVPVELPPEQVEVPDIDAAAGVPDELTAEEVSLDADVEAQSQRIEESGMTTEPAQLVEDGPIADARAGLTDLEAAAAADPQQVLADQEAAIAAAAGDMQALQEAAEQALSQARSGTVGTLGTMSTEITGSEEEQRAQAGERMQAIFERARTDVDALLSPLSEAALARWEAGVDQLASNFESSLASVKQRIEERYRTEDDWDPFDEIGAGLTQAWDYVAGLPDWVVEEYDRAEQAFADGCTSLITDISRDVNAVIEDCQAIIQQARDDIDAIVTSLPEELQAWAQGEAARLGTELDALESQVTETRQTLNQDLIDRSNAAVQEVRERVHELREQAKGVIGRIGDAIAAFLEDPGRAIIDGLLRVLGIPPTNFWALVDQLGNVIDGIAEDPMGFANTMMAGVGQGFQQFFGNFPLHIGQSLFAWLFSKMGEVGVTMPRDFSIPSIVSLVLDVLGINWQRIRVLLARHIGEQNVAHIEQAYDIITTFIARGPLGLVELMREQLDPAMIVDMIRETAIRYLMESIVTRVAARILMMLNPAGAILQAIEAIYRVLSWIYENAARIFTLIEAVVNGAAQILAGNTAGLAALVEHALVGLMVPVIDFLADYLGLGGIPMAIRNLIQGLQDRVERILDRVIGFVAERARALLAAMGIGGRRGAEGAGDDDAGSHQGMVRQVVETLSRRPQGVEGYDEVRAAKEAEARELEQRHAPLLAAETPPVRLTITFAEKTADQRDDDLDFTVRIAPNDEVQTGSVPAGPDEPPPTQVTHAQNGDRAGWVQAEPLSKTPGNTTGSRPSGSIPGWDHVLDIDNVLLNPKTAQWGPAFWVKAHLLSEQLHGPGRPWNLVPARKTDNSQMERGPESNAKRRIDAGETLYYRASVTYHDGDVLENFPATINIEYGSMKREGDSWVRDASFSPLMLNLAPPPLDTSSARVVDLKTAGRSQLETLGVDRGLAGRIQRERGTGGVFRDQQDFTDRMTRAYAALTPPVDFMAVHWPAIQRLIDDEKASF